MRQFINIKVNGNFKGHNKGDVVKVEVDRNGIPFDPFWRRRLRDAKSDNCVSVIGKKEEEGKKKGGK